MNALTRRRLRAFFRQGRAQLGTAAFGMALLLAGGAELWSHHHPWLMKRDGQWYWPAFKRYPAQTFGITDSFVVDYRQLVADDHAAGKATWAVFPPNPWDPYIQTSDVLAPPSSAHKLGTDNLGRDVLARLAYGARVSLIYGILFWLGAFAIGIVIGALQGYFGGRVDFVAERFKELAEIVPFLSVIILVNGLVHAQTFWVTLGVVILLSWIAISSQVRAQFLSLRRREFCEAAVALGARPSRVIFRHILPNALTPILTLSPLAISGGIATLTILDYLGFGLNPPTPSLGELLSQGRNYIINAPWILLATTATLAWMLISINLIGEALRKAFDPKRG